MTKSASGEWIGLERLAAEIDCDVSKLEALVRQNHWPRIYSADGTKVLIDVETARQAADGSPVKVHGSLSAR